MEALNDSARAGGERFFPGRRFLKTAESFMDFPFLEPRGWGKSSAAQPRTNCSEFPYVTCFEKGSSGISSEFTIPTL